MTIGRTITPGGNIFRELGFGPMEAENLRIRSDLMIEIRRIVEERGLTRADAAKLFGTTQPLLRDLMRGNVGQFTIDSLVDMLTHAGVQVELHLAGTPSYRAC